MFFGGHSKPYGDASESIVFDYFDDFTLDDVLKKSRVCNEWDEKLSAYELAKETFLDLKFSKTTNKMEQKKELLDFKLKSNSS